MSDVYTKNRCYYLLIQSNGDFGRKPFQEGSKRVIWKVIKDIYFTFLDNKKEIFYHLLTKSDQINF